MLRIDIQTLYPNAMLRCAGRIVLGVEAETLRCMVTSRSEDCLSLDLSAIRGIDAAGLGLLVELHCWAEERGKNLWLVNPSTCVCRLIAMTNLQSVLRVVPGEKSDSIDIHDCAALAMRAGQVLTA